MQTRLATGMLLPTSGHLNVQNARNAEHPQPASAEQGQHGESVAKQMIHRNHKAFHHAAAKCNEKATATHKIARSTSMELHVALQLLTKTKPKNTTTAFQHSGCSFIGAPVVFLPLSLRCTYRSQGVLRQPRGSPAASSESAPLQPPTSYSQVATSSWHMSTLRQNSLPHSISSSSSSSHSSTTQHLPSLQASDTAKATHHILRK